MKKELIIASCLIFVSGCTTISSAKEISPDAAKIELGKQVPNRNKCEFLGDVQGSSKSYSGAKATTNSRTDIRIKAHDMGANFVALDTTSMGNAMDFSGRSEAILTGRAYSCK